MKKRPLYFRLAALLAAMMMLTPFFAALAEDETPSLPIELRREDLVDKQKNPYGLVKGYNFTATYRENPVVYEDPTIRVEFHGSKETERIRVEGNKYFTRYFYAFVTIGHPSQIRTAPADTSRGFAGNSAKQVKQMAQMYNAVLAINGDFFSRGGVKEAKYCLRQGVVYRDAVTDYLDMLLIDEDGDFHIYKAGPELAGMNKEEIDGKKIINAFQFGPALVIDGEPVADEIITDRGHAPAMSEPDILNPRMCIAQIDRLQYFVLATWHGVTLPQLRDLVLSITPCQTLYVLDGGNSSQMVYLKTHINLNEGQNDRTVSDMIWFASAYQD